MRLCVGRLEGVDAGRSKDVPAVVHFLGAPTCVAVQGKSLTGGSAFLTDREERVDFFEGEVAKIEHEKQSVDELRSQAERIEDQIAQIKFVPPLSLMPDRTH